MLNILREIAQAEKHGDISKELSKTISLEIKRLWLELQIIENDLENARDTRNKVSVDFTDHLHSFEAAAVRELKAEVTRLNEAIEKIENIFLFDDNPPEEPDMRIWNIVRDAQGKPK